MEKKKKLNGFSFSNVGLTILENCFNRHIKETRNKGDGDMNLFLEWLTLIILQIDVKTREPFTKSFKTIRNSRRNRPYSFLIQYSVRWLLLILLPWSEPFTLMKFFSFQSFFDTSHSWQTHIGKRKISGSPKTFTMTTENTDLRFISGIKKSKNFF